MKHIISALFLSSLCVAALAANVKPTDSQLKELEKQLMNAPLVEEVAEFDDGDSSKRSWNPINWMKNKLRNKCKCETGKCECCFKLKIFQNVACFSAQTVKDNQNLAISFKMDDTSLVDRTFDLRRNDQVCGGVPTIPFLKFCFTQQSEVQGDGSVASCPSIDFRIGGTVGAVIQFKCLELKAGKLSFGGYKEVEKSNMLVLKAKNPFKAAVALYKKAAGKN